MRVSAWPPAIGITVDLHRISPGLLGWSGIPFIVLLAPDVDDTIWQHELVHQRQIWRWWVVGFWVGYIFSTRFRQRMENEAYANDGAHLDLD